MPSPYRIEGFAIVSADGMLAGADGVMPPELFIEGDQAFFEQGLDQAAAVIHGRNSQEQQPRSAERVRLIATHGVKALEPQPSNPKALLWNPATTPFEEGLRALGVTEGRIGIIGGTHIFGLFLPRYDLFHLSRAGQVRLPGGRPVFPQVPDQTPENVLQRHGLRPGPVQVLDSGKDASLVTWRRTSSDSRPGQKK
jgi:dihydrofolate reductase